MSDPSLSPAGKAILLYDGECRFCCKWVERWRESGEGRVEMFSSQSGAGEKFGFPAAESLQAVQLIESEGEIRSGAAALFRLMALCGSTLGSLLWWIYCRVAFLRFVTEWGYRLVAGHRSFFSMLTRLLWGESVHRPTYEKSSWIFLRLLGVVYLTAFGGLWWQIDGLVGPSGILPAGDFLEHAQETLGSDAWRVVPTLFWITGCSTLTLNIICALGTILAVLSLWLPLGPLFLVLEALYLSLVSIGQIFMGYQWDALLLEAGFFGVLLAWSLPRHKVGQLSWGLFTASRCLLVWLLFRLIFSSALVKWLSGDSSWHDLTALDYHFWTQPLPTPIGWLAAQLPQGALKLMTLGMFVIEFGAPWLLLGPRNLRLLGAALIVFLQLLIALTGNYGFFNLLALALCVLVVDDLSWPHWIFRKKEIIPHVKMKRVGFLQKGIVLLCVLFVLILSLVPTSIVPMPRLIVSAYEALEPFHLVSGYGLFAVMTKQRLEIIVEGSEDGVVWKPYEFRFKPGNLHRPPPFVPLLMPRLDWQMWFAALGPVNESPWFENFLVRVFQGNRSVLRLLGEDPFAGKTPRFLRARMESYHFSTPGELSKDGLWWTATPEADYLPAVEIKAR